MSAVEIIDFPYRSDADSLFAAVKDLPDPVWLDSGKPWSLQGRFDIITAQPLSVLETRAGETRIHYPTGQSVRCTDEPFSLARDALHDLGMVGEEFSGFPFTGGLAGFFGYDLGRGLLGLATDNTDVTTMPDMRLGVYPWALVLNHQLSKSWLIFHPRCPAATRSVVTERLSSPSKVSEVDFSLTEAFSPATSLADYRKALARIQHYIRAGDCYQVNYTQRFSAAYQGNTWPAYRRLRRQLPSPFSAYIAWEDRSVLSLSPERFLKVSVNQVETKPIKGTIRRGRTVAEDQDNAVRLMNSAKDRAENLMIVDLLRNDLGKTCETGSIRVPKLFALETFANVHHLVSTITGILAPGEDALSLLRGCFPGGSITGAPKKRAMEIIDELEPCRRSLYCGSVGYISSTGRMDTNIAIRTLIAADRRLHCWGGGGIVADSDTDAEYRESIDKIGVLMRALEKGK